MRTPEKNDAAGTVSCAKVSLALSRCARCLAQKSEFFVRVLRLKKHLIEFIAIES